MSTQQYVILSRESASNNGMAPLGSRKDLVAQLSSFNTAPERSGEDDPLYGPGILVSLPPMTDPVTQMLVSITEEEIGWQVLLRIAKHYRWKIVDTSSGRELTP